MTETMQAEMTRLGAEFPLRTKRGVVTGFYLTNRDGEELAGPFPTPEEADEANRHRGFFGERVACAPVYTSAGTIVREAK